MYVTKKKKKGLVCSESTPANYYCKSEAVVVIPPKSANMYVLNPIPYLPIASFDS